VNDHQIANHLRFYQELGVRGVSRDRAWRQRESAGAPSASEDAEPTLNAEAGAPDAAPVTIARSVDEALASIRDDLGECTRCKLHTLGRTQIVYGVGNETADLMFVGEAPGADEDVQGEPFVGRAGQLLTKMIEAMGLARDDVYICNVVKCRPPNNRDPEPDEVEACEGFLRAQIAMVQPQVVVTLGRHAAQALLRTQRPITTLRGTWHKYEGKDVMPTFHPSFLLRAPEKKREAWADLQQVMARLGLSGRPPGTT
jgi:DNA polymerase